ncbi:hypothetical protein TeGR_g3543 [Tetraparma gracilis]|uniref:NECAP PHear domain-containing protein n=1 Tax=Tetraparma gracilis TaxID=2962635 RepID=A0ABQ6MN10_9STRA|nr:hypothetical protein TeGR_g3543 [Tetraparma gracilis]
MSGFSPSTQQLLLSVPEVYVYQVPTLANSLGHRAESWNLASPALTGSLKAVLEKGGDGKETFVIEVYSTVPNAEGPPGATKPSLFARCSIDLRNNPGKTVDQWVDPVVDSSRYFVVRFSDEKTGRQALLGVGFRERDDSLAFTDSLNSHAREVRREQEAEREREKREEGGGGEAVEAPMLDLSLKEGEKISISIGGREPRKKKKAAAAAAGGFLLRPPPPSAGSGPAPSASIGIPPASPPPTTATPASTPSAGLAGGSQGVSMAALGAAMLGGGGGGGEEDDEDFGDFQG